MTEFPRLLQALIPGPVPAGLFLPFLAGCTVDGQSDYERWKEPQREAAAALRQAGAAVTEVRSSPLDSWTVEFPRAQVTDELLDCLKKLQRITKLDLSYSTITDAQVARLNEVEIGGLLGHLDLSHTAVTDRGLEKLTNLKLLQNLNLTGTKVTAGGVEGFKKNRGNDPKILPKFKTPEIRL
jgi:hypothetical protein